jgi:hypothetical protein
MMTIKQFLLLKLIENTTFVSAALEAGYQIDVPAIFKAFAGVCDGK